jgi:superfamily II DNA/RNA helicase
MSDAAFTNLQGSVCEPTLKGIADMGFVQMTEIQAKTIPPLLEGRSVCITHLVHFVITVACVKEFNH